MDKLELIRYIGNEICEGCDPERDCGLEYDDCFRIQNAISAFDEFQVQSVVEVRQAKSMIKYWCPVCQSYSCDNDSHNAMIERVRG